VYKSFTIDRHIGGCSTIDRGEDEAIMANPIRLDDRKLLGKTRSGTKMTGSKTTGIKPVAPASPK
jgi:hypothetical protein